MKILFGFLMLLSFNSLANYSGVNSDLVQHINGINEVLMPFANKMMFLALVLLFLLFVMKFCSYILSEIYFYKEPLSDVDKKKIEPLKEKKILLDKVIEERL